MKEPVDGVARVVECSPPSMESTSSNYTLDCVVSADGVEPVAVQHKGMAPVDKWPTLGSDLPIVLDKRHPSRFIIKWDRIEKSGTEAWMKAGKQRAQALAEQMQSGAPAPPAATGRPQPKPRWVTPYLPSASTSFFPGPTCPPRRWRTTPARW